MRSIWQSITKRSVCFSLLIILAVNIVFAQDDYDDDLVDDTSTSLDSEDIDIDGTFNKPTEADRMRKSRENLEKQNKDMVDKKIEDIRLREEKKLGKKLKKAFSSGNLNDLNNKKEKKPAPPPPPVVKATPKKKVKKNAVIPYLGFSFFEGSDVDYESSTSFGIGIETFLTEQMSLGIGFSYISMEIQDRCNSGSHYPSPYDYPFTRSSTYYRTFCNDYYTLHFPNDQGRIIEYSKMAFDIIGKYFLKLESKIMPYIGFGLGYNRISADYQKGADEPYRGTAPPYYHFKEEGYNAGQMMGIGIFGAEITFTDRIGMDMALRYSTSLSGGLRADKEKNALDLSGSSSIGIR